MEKIVDTKCGRTDVFEPVNEVPNGYYVWNIGRKNFPYEKCVPLAKDGPREYEWQKNVDLNALKYIVVPSEEIALKILEEAARHGCKKERFYEILNG